MKLPAWQMRILKALGIDPDSERSKKVLAGFSKHSRQRQKQKHYVAMRRKKRKAAKIARRRSRPRYAAARGGGHSNGHSSRSWR